MEVYRRSSWLLLLLGVAFVATTLKGVQGQVESEGPSESECRPYIEKALKELATEDNAVENAEALGSEEAVEDVPTVEITTDDSDHNDGDRDDDNDSKDKAESSERAADAEGAADESDEEFGKSKDDENAESAEHTTGEDSDETQDTDNKSKSEEVKRQSEENDDDSKETSQNIESAEEATGEGHSTDVQSQEYDAKSAEHDVKNAEDSEKSTEEDNKSTEEDKSAEFDGNSAEDDGKSAEGDTKNVENANKSTETDDKSDEDDTKSVKDESKSDEGDEQTDENGNKSTEYDEGKSSEDNRKSSKEDSNSGEDDAKSTESTESNAKSAEDKGRSDENETRSGQDDADNAAIENKNVKEVEETKDESAESKPDESDEEASPTDKINPKDESSKSKNNNEEDLDGDGEGSNESVPEEELTNEIDIPTELRPRDHIDQLLKLDEKSSEKEKIINRVSEITLRELKRLYENAIKPLEVLYKYRDLSNRHFGDPEIFAKPLVLFMGPWSGGKSSIINYLLDNEYNDTSLRTGAEPSPAYFNILMYGDEPEVLEGTQLAADYTFSGLQKFGQGLEERLRGLKLPMKLLQKINIVEIPGILEVRKQVSRLFPFNDACQWFIDRADIIFLVYDPSKLDVGPETEAILDQLKGREHQTKIILNKADQVKPEELMRVQGALIWNISPLMSSAQPPVMYITSLWSRPYEVWAPVRLLQAQERAFLRDLRSAVDKRIENKIASARRFAVRVRNHAKMVDCYLTTYYNHKSVFGNKKQVADEIIEHPQDYHIYEGISTLTNISRYDLPDPDVYRDFFKLNPLYDFQQLSATCTYFRGCPINRLDVAIAYDLPELVGKHRRLIESALLEANLAQTPES